MMRYISYLAGCAVFPLFLTGCSAPNVSFVQNDTVYACDDSNFRSLGHLVYQASDSLVRQLQTDSVSEDSVAVTTVVDIDDLDKSSTLGREISRLVASRLTQRKFAVQDLNFTRALQVVPKTGELILSREAKLLIQNMKVQLVAVGSYANLNGVIYINIRLLNATSGIVIASTDIAVPHDDMCDEKGGRSRLLIPDAD